MRVSVFVIGIVIVSTFMHAGWNLLARYDRSEEAFYNKMLIAIIVVGFLPAVISEISTRSLTPLAWACVLGSGTSAALYLFSLARAFEASDFTVVYPVARSIPVLFLAFIDVFRGRYLTQLGWVGIVLVAAGCTLVPLRSLGDISLGKYFNRASLWMLLAAAGTVGYTSLDKVAAEVVQQGPATAARYGYIYFSVSFLPYLALRRGFRNQHTTNNAAGWKLAIPAAALSFGAYWLILWAYQLSPYASYIVAFRQFSIVIGSLLAFLIYKEQGIGVRLSGALLITSGLILIGVWGR
jgi:drug/metabolite transporter (DMT)-like permease